MLHVHCPNQNEVAVSWIFWTCDLLSWSLWKWQGGHIIGFNFVSPLKTMSINLYLSILWDSNLFAIHPSIHWNPWGGFYVRPGPQASAGRQSSSKQCLLSWRRLGLTSHAGCSSLPYVTVKSQWPHLRNQAESVRGRTENKEVGLNEKCTKTCINPYWSDSEQGTDAQRGR